MRSSGRGCGPWFWKTVVGGRHHEHGHVDERLEHARGVGLPDTPAGAFRHDRPDGRRSSGRLEQLLASDGEAERADPGIIDIGPALEVLGTGEQVRVACPADDVPFARALSARDEEEHAVTVAGEHEAFLRAPCSAIQDHRCAVLRGDVRRREVESVARRHGDALLADPEVRHRGRAPDVDVSVREGDREDDQYEDQGHCHDGDGDAQRPERVAASPASANPAGAPQDHRARHEQDQCRWECEERRVVVEGGASVRDVVDARESDRADDGSQGHRGRSAHAGTKVRVQESQRAEDRERDEAAQEMIACGRARRGVDEVVVDDDDRDKADREQEQPVLATSDRQRVRAAHRLSQAGGGSRDRSDGRHDGRGPAFSASAFR